MKPLTLAGTGMGKIIKMFLFCISNYNSSLSKGIKKSGVEKALTLPTKSKTFCFAS